MHVGTLNIIEIKCLGVLQNNIPWQIVLCDRMFVDKHTTSDANVRKPLIHLGLFKIREHKKYFVTFQICN